MNLKIDWKPKKQQWLIMLLVGIMLVVIALPTEKPDTKSEIEPINRKGNDSYMSDYETEMEEKLETKLQYVAGIGKVEVMLTLKSTAEKVIEKDRTTLEDSMEETTIYEDASENQIPYVKKEITPEVEGVVVIAQGGGNPETVQHITEAIQALFDVDTHKIKIMKMNHRK